MQENSLKNGISVIVPVYNSRNMIPVLVQRIQVALSELDRDFELIMVNDCSKDGSWEVIKDVARKEAWVHGVNLMKNYGQHNALLCGIRQAQYNISVTIDDDLQHPPEEIGKLITKLEEDNDVIYGKPKNPKHNAYRKLASRVIRIVLGKTLNGETASNVSAFRAFRTRLRDAFSNYNGQTVSVDLLLSWGASRFGVVQVEHSERLEGVSNYTFVKLLSHSFEMITGFSILPLRLASIMGFVFILFGLFILMYVIGRLLITGYSVPGFPFLASIIVIFSGVQLFAIGIMGEYLARIHMRSTGLPTYTIGETTDEINLGGL